jgi:hypothetical protein
LAINSNGLQPGSFLGNNLYAQNFPTTTVGSYTYRNTVSIVNGQMVLFIGLGALAGINPGGSPSCGIDQIYGCPGASSINDPYSLVLPTGVTYTSAFQQSIAAVPEPETYAMMLAGLGMMGFTVRRRKQAQASRVSRHRSRATLRGGPLLSGCRQFDSSPANINAKALLVL